MFLMRFTERAYTNYTEEDVRNSPNQAVRLTFSNSNFDPMVGSRQYNEYLDEYEYCEEVGFRRADAQRASQHPHLPGRHHEPGGRHPRPQHQDAQDSAAGQPPAGVRQPAAAGRRTGRD